MTAAEIERAESGESGFFFQFEHKRSDRRGKGPFISRRDDAAGAAVAR